MNSLVCAKVTIVVKNHDMHWSTEALELARTFYGTKGILVNY